MRKLTEVTVREKIGVANVIAVGIYLVSSIAVVSIIGGVILQLALTAPVVMPAAVDTTNSVTLQWTAPGDDANVGTATRYEVRYATNLLSEETWASASLAPNPPVPQPAGTTQSMVVKGLTPGTQYYFALKSFDEAGNVSAISNIASKKTELVACVPEWSCTEWSTCKDGVQTRACTDIANPPCGTDFNRPIEQQTCMTVKPPPDPERCIEDWSCSKWTDCVDGTRTRVCEDRNRCGTESKKPETVFDCSVGGQPPDDPDLHYLLTALARGGEPLVKAFHGETGTRTAQFYAYSRNYRSGLSIAGGDINRDGSPDVVVGTGQKRAPQVSVFSKDGNVLTRFFPYAKRLQTGVNVAVADVDGDGNDDLVTVPGENFPSLVRVFRYDPVRNKFTRFTEFGAQVGRYRGGANLAAGDLDRNGLAEVVVAPANKGRRSTIEVYEYDLTSRKMVRRHGFLAYAQRFQSGVKVTVGDVDGDGNNEIITGPAPGATDVRVFTYSNHRTKLLGRFFAASTAFRGGVDVTSFDTNQDGSDEVITVSFSKGLPGVRVFSRNKITGAFERLTSPFPAYVYSTRIQTGVRLGTM